MPRDLLSTYFYGIIIKFMIYNKQKMRQIIELTKTILINLFLAIITLLLIIPLTINHIIFLYKKKKKPFVTSPIVHLLECCPIIYEISILIWNFPIFSKIYNNVFFKENSKILQIGCGTGLFNKFIKNHKLEIINLDINNAYLNYGAKHNRFKTFVNNSVYKIEYANEIFDYVFFARCYHHIRKQKKALIECSRVLKSKGEIIIFDPVSVHPNLFQTRYINTEYDGLIYDYHKETYKNYILSILPEELELKKLEFKKNLTVTNYNIRYPHTDAILYLRKK